MIRNDRHAILRRGLVALVKSAVLVAGVPASLIRLWYLRSLPPHLLSRAGILTSSSLVHLVICAVGVLWAWAAANLVLEVRQAVRHHDTDELASWSTRWASRIAGLVLFATAGTATTTSLAALSSNRATAVAVAAIRQNPAAQMSERTDAREPTMASTAVVGAGESLTDFAGRTTGERAAWVEIARANLDAVQLDGARFVDANLVRSGWRLVVPRAEPTVQHSPAPKSGSAWLAELEILGLGILTTAALVRRVRTLRRLGASSRADGATPLPPDHDVGAVEANIVPLGDSNLVGWVDAALRLLGDAAARLVVGERPEVTLVRAGPDGVEFLLERSLSPAPAPFAARGGGRWWALGPEMSVADATAAAAGLRRFAPWFVPLGDDGDAIYLAAIGPGSRLRIDGPKRPVDAAISGIVAALRTLPWAEELEVELLGIDPPPAEEQCFQLVASSPATLEDLAAAPGLVSRSNESPRWRREPLVVVGPGSELECSDGLLEAVQGIASGVITTTGTGTMRLVLFNRKPARLEPFEIPASCRDSR